MARRIAVIGAGSVGSALAHGFHRTGHQVTVGARDPARAAGLSETGIAVAPPEGATAEAEVVVLAVPVAALADVIDTVDGAAGRILVDATNAVGTPVPDGFDTVGAMVASLAPDAQVVKAFNTIGAEHLSDGVLAGRAAFLPVAGDDDGRPVVVELARDLGFDVADLGGPDAVRMVEDAARLWIHLAFRCGWGRDFGFGVLRP